MGTLLWATFCLTSLLAAQTALRVDSDLVLIPATVVDPKDRLMLDLGQSQFHLFDRGQEQPITHFAVEEGPVSLAILFDASRSMRGSIGDERAAVKVMIESIRPDDEVALICFSDHAALEKPFSAAPSEILESLNAIQARGGTSLLDSIMFAMRYVRKQARHPRRAILLFTDGGERDSRHTWTEVRNAAREADLRLYVFFRSSTPPDDPFGQAMLRGIAEESGGRCYDIDRRSQLRQAAQKLDLHWHYVLGYRPREPERDGRYHKVEVRLGPSPGTSRLKIFWRKGYVAAP